MTDAEIARQAHIILDDWANDRATSAQVFDRLHRLFYPSPRAKTETYALRGQEPRTQLSVDGMTVADDAGNPAVGRKLREIAHLINSVDERSPRPDPGMKGTGG